MQHARIAQKYQYGFRDDLKPTHTLEPGLSKKVVEEISSLKNEPDWMREKRLQALEIFESKPVPTWGADLSKLNFDQLRYYIRPTDRKGKSWDEVPAEIKRTFDRIGVPQAERDFLAGVEAQYDSEVIYGNLKKEWEDQGIIFCDTDTALQKYPDIVKRYFGTVVPAGDNKFAALNSAVWSGGSFVYVPAGKSVTVPLQAYFRINQDRFGQFERTLIIAEEGSTVHYVEGCTAPIYRTDSLHAAVVEVIVKKGARVRYTTIQNWSPNIYNLVTKRAFVYEDATMEWVDGNLGCLTGDTPVLLNSDVKAIRDIETDDVVYSLDESMQLIRNKVLGKKYSGRQRVFRIQTENFREVKATANHPFLALTKSGKHVSLTWKRLDQLTTNDLIAIAGSIPDHGQSRELKFTPTRGMKSVVFPRHTSGELMWLLGVYIGDGYVDRSRVYFAVPPQDKSHARLMRLFQQLFGVALTRYRNTVRVNSAQLVDWFMSLGVGGKAREKRVPRWVYTLPKSQRLAFIEGYIAADGYQRKNHKNISITSVNRLLLEDIKSLAISCGLDPRKISRWTRRERKPLGKEEKEYTHYFLYFGDKKYDQPVYFSRVTKIEPVGVEDTWDIEVEGAHNFVANGLIVHNSKVTMKYPSVFLWGKGARGDVLSVALAGEGQHQDAGAKAMHLAPFTSSTITSKSVSHSGGKTTYRGQLKIIPGAKGAKSNVRCDALILDGQSSSETIPVMNIFEQDVTVGHEASVGRVSEDQLFYLTSRGINGDQALSMIVNGFIEPITKELPLEYAVELNRLIRLEMEGSVG